jgi:hypothetical protein
VTNSGGVNATAVADGLGLAAPYDWKNGTYPGTGGTCGTTITTSTPCTVVVTFSPTIAGTQNDTIVINYNNGVGVVNTQRQVEGVGADAANLTISDGPTFNWNIVTVGFSAQYTFTITNTGDISATSVGGTGLGAPYSFFGGSGYPGGGTCLTSIAPGASCTVIVEFTPTGSGTANDTMQITYNDGVTSQISNRDMTATGYENNAVVSLQNPATSPNNVSTPTIRINNLVAGVTSRLYSDAGCANEVSTDVAVSATTDATSSILTDNTYEFHVRVEDSYGNITACSTSSVDYILDTGTPDPSLWTWLMNSPNDGTDSSDPTPQINMSSATGENGTSVQLYDEATCTNNVGSPRVVASQAATFSDISYLTNGTQDGQKIYYAVASDVAGNISGCTPVGLDYFLDQVNPNAASGLATASVWHTPDTASAPQFSWAAVSDPAPSSGVDRIEVAISTQVGGGNEAGGWTALAPGATSHTYSSGLALTECSPYYPSIRVIDNAQNVSNTVTAPSFRVDITNPTDPVISRGTDQNTTQSPTVTIDTASTDNCSFSQYQALVSRDDNDNGVLDAGEQGNIQTWVNIGNVGTYQYSGTLAPGSRYIVSIRGVDAAGRTSNIVSTDAWGIPIEYIGSWQQGLTHVPTAGSSRMLFVTMAMDVESNDSDLIAMTYGGQAMFPVGEANATATNNWTTRTEIWACNEACISAATNNNINPTFANGATKHPSYASAMFQYVNQASPVFDTASNQSTSAQNLTTPLLNENETGINIASVGHGNTAVFLAVPPGYTESGGQTSAQSEHNSGHLVIQADGANTYFFNSNSTQRMAAVVVHINPQ